MRIVKFETKDAAGEPHLYEVELFSCDENASLQLTVGQPIMELVAGIVQAVIPAFAAGMAEQMASGAKLSEMAEHLKAINVATLPQYTAPLFRMIEERGGPALVARIFARTKRATKVKELQGIPSVSDVDVKDYVTESVAEPAVRDRAYGDGNMGEYWLAALMVLVVNFFPVGRERPATWTDAVPLLTGGLLQP